VPAADEAPSSAVPPASFDHDEVAARAEQADPLSQGGLWIRQRPQQVPGEHDVESQATHRRLAGITEHNRRRVTGDAKFALGQRDHVRRQINAGDTVAVTGQDE
jgi:hypothetical protein